MPNLTLHISTQDFYLLKILDDPYYYLNYLFAIIKNILFYTCIYLLSRKQAKILQDYRIYLTILLTTVYIFGLAFFLWQPLLLMPHIIVCSNSPFKFLGSYYTLTIMIITIFAFFSHAISYMFCLFYQYASADFTKIITVKKIFSTRKIPLTIFGVIVVGLWALVAVFLAMVDFDFDPAMDYLFGNEMFYSYLSKILGDTSALIP